MRPIVNHLTRLLTITLTLALLAGCASNTEKTPNPNLVNEDSIGVLERWLMTHPNDVAARARLARARELAQIRLLRDADVARQRGDYTTAERLYGHVLAIVPGQSQAMDGLVRIAQARRQRELVTEATQLIAQGDEASARQRLQQVMAESPNHSDARQLMRDLDARAATKVVSPTAGGVLDKPVSMEFRNVPLSVIFNLLSKSTGVQFVFDRDVRMESQASIFVHNATLLEALNLLLTSQQLDKQLLNGRSILIYPANPGKQRDLQQLQVRSFYLGNAEAKQTVNLLKTILKIRDVYVDEKLNMLVVRDTPEAIDLAARVIATQDLAEPEVVLEVEVLEVATSRLTELGLRWPDQMTLGLKGSGGTPGFLDRGEFRNLKDSNVIVGITDPAFILNLHADDGDTTTLANPRIRVKNREKAKVHIGDRVPVITTTTNQNTGSVAESVNYLDVGLKLEMEPLVFLDNDVQIKLSLEVSNIVKEIKTSTGLLAYQVGTRNTSTALRLKDGETQVIAGLIKREGTNSSTKVPGLGDLPLLGKLFGSERRNQANTEIVLLVTPRVIRNLTLPAAGDQTLPAGTDAAPGERGLQLNNRAEVGVQPSRAATAPAAPGLTDENAAQQELLPQRGPAQAPEAAPAPPQPAPAPAAPAAPENPASGTAAPTPPASPGARLRLPFPATAGEG